MGLTGPWPYLLFFSLDGAAGVCAVLLMRRAARAESGLAPRLAVWGLVAASAAFNADYAPRRPAAPEAFALMPVIAATLFEFTLRELRLRTGGRPDRKLAGLSWLHPVERIRVQLLLSAEGGLSAEAATRRARVERAGWRLYRLRLALDAQDQAVRPRTVTTWRARRLEHRAHAALTRAGFATPAIAADILRQVQVLTITPSLARLDYTTASEALTAVSNLITRPAPGSSPPGPAPVPLAPADQDGGPHIPATAGQLNDHPARPGTPLPAAPGLRVAAGPEPGPVTPNGHAATGPEPELTAANGSQPPAERAAPPYGDDDRDVQLVAAATRIIAEAGGRRLSQAALAERLRSQGYSIANSRLNWLASACGLDPRHG